MKTVRFDAILPSRIAGAYLCNQAGDCSGEYVPAEVARQLLAALEGLLPICDNDGPLARAYDDRAEVARTAIAAASAEEQLV